MDLPPKDTKFEQSCKDKNWAEKEEREKRERERRGFTSVIFLLYELQFAPIHLSSVSRTAQMDNY